MFPSDCVHNLDTLGPLIGTYLLLFVSFSEWLTGEQVLGNTTQYHPKLLNSKKDMVLCQGIKHCSMQEDQKLIWLCRCTLNSVVNWYQEARKHNQTVIPVMVGSKFDFASRILIISEINFLWQHHHIVDDVPIG
ncbi:unnamed protein product [Lactuca virosa]|uniref:Uncharacterized protein n=1 Tax=Lactuca virosa TaxID=75947 RepID=A0AAU9N712_9ASTR|nr:unnamed protein product [Lactuca virosa]